MRCVYTLETSDRKSQKHCLQNILMDQKMFVAAAEESRQNNLVQGRGDAYCGMLNASYNLKTSAMLGAYIPEYPVGDCRGMCRYDP